MAKIDYQIKQMEKDIIEASISPRNAPLLLVTRLEPNSKIRDSNETQLIINKNIKEVHGSLIEAPQEYHIVSEIAKYYIFMSGTNYE